MPEVVTKTKAISGIGTAKAMISSARIGKRVQELGKQISEVYADIDTPLVMVVILKGATVFAADLLRSLSIPAELEFVRASSYGSATTSSGKVKFAHLVEGPLTGRHLLLVEVGVDAGDLLPHLADALGDPASGDHRPPTAANRGQGLGEDALHRVRSVYLCSQP